MKNGKPTVEEAKALLAEYQSHCQRGQGINQRIRATVRALGLEQNYGYPLTILKEAVADYEVRKHWPPKPQKQEKK
jgi:hypothetical protein